MILTPEELAERWRVPKSQIYRQAREGAIPSIHIGKYVRFKLDAIERFEDSGDVTAERA